MFKRLLLVLAAAACLASPVQAGRVKCQDAISPTDVIAMDHDADGKVIEYKRNAEDIESVIAALKKKISDDPSITQSPYWEARMLTSIYWAKERCGGTKNCSTKECSSGDSCVYRSLGMAGCRCEKKN